MRESSPRPGALGRLGRALLEAAPREAALAVLLTLAAGATEGVGLLLLVPLLQLVGLDIPGGLSRIAAGFGEAFRAVGVRPTLGAVLPTYLLVVGLQSVLQRRQTILSVALEQRIMVALRTRLYGAIARMQWLAFARTRPSDVAEVLTEEVGRVGSATQHLVGLFVAGTTTLVYVGLAMRVSLVMTGGVIVGGGVLLLVVRGRIEEARRTGSQLTTSWERLYAAIAEHLGSLKIAKEYGVVPRHIDMFAAACSDLAANSMAYAGSSSRLRQQLSFGSAAVLAVVVFVSFRVLGVAPSQLILLLFLFARLVPRITGIYERVQELAAALPAVAAVDELERRCVDAAEAPSTRRRGIAFHDSIALDGVTFAYGDPTRPPAVVDLTLRIRSGATVAIVGPSGAGKSTVADLLMGLLVPDSGRILIDGTALEADRLEAWREQIGYVPQDTFLFHETIAANLRWAQPAATDEELWIALRHASADAFVRALPRGMETIVGDRGVLLSAGERQRISVARALLRRPKLLIFDEATSALDSENERRIQEAIDGLHGHVTIVIITHRLAAVRGADVIHVMERGRLVESGTWAALLARPGGRFRALCRAQGLEGYTTAAVATEGEAAEAAVTR